MSVFLVPHDASLPKHDGPADNADARRPRRIHRSASGNGFDRRRGLRKALLLAVHLTGFLALSSLPAIAGPIDHSRWDRLLHSYVRDGLVDYSTFSRDRPGLDSYLADLASTPRAVLEAASPAERMAFWINVYNASAVALVLDHLPIDSIRDIVPLWKRAVGRGVFTVEFIPMGSLYPTAPLARALSLDDVEHGILAAFGEPRLHFALVCASRSCPELRSEAYAGDRLGDQLDQAGHRFLGDPAKNRLQPGGAVLELSSIFQWYAADFEPLGGPLGVARRYLAPDQAALVSQQGKPPEIRYLPYDWKLNSR